MITTDTTNTVVTTAITTGTTMKATATKVSTTPVTKHTVGMQATVDMLGMATETTETT